MIVRLSGIILFLLLTLPAYGQDYKGQDQQGWPVFKKRAAFVISETKKMASNLFNLGEKKFLVNLALLLKNTLFLDNLQIEGNSLVSSGQVLAASGFSSGKWIWEVNLENSERGLKQLAWVKSASPKVSIFPVGMKIVVEEYSAWMLAEFGRRLWIVSENGSLLSPVAEVKNIETLRSFRSLPRLIGLGDGTQWANETYLSSENARYHHAIMSLKFLKEAGGLPFRVGLIKLLPDGALEITPAERSKQHPEVILQVSNIEQVKEKIKILNNVLADLKNKNELATKIDLRFEDRAIAS